MNNFCHDDIFEYVICPNLNVIINVNINPANSLAFALW